MNSKNFIYELLRGASIWIKINYSEISVMPF
jgi:hypothetical protein